MKQFSLFLLLLLCNTSIFAQKEVVKSGNKPAATTKPTTTTAAAVEAGSAGTVDKIIAIIGEKAILMSDVEDQFHLMQQQAGKPLPEEARCEILDQVIMQELMVSQGKLDSLKVTDEEVEQELTARIEKILGYMNNDPKQFEQYYGMPVVKMKDRMRTDMRDQLFSKRMQAKVMENVSVTPAEVRVFFDKIPQDSLPFFNAEVEYAQLVLKPKVSEAALKKAVTTLAELRDQILNKKADFADLAKKYSDDKGSGKEGGDLGWVKRGQFVPEFEAAAFKLNRGEYSSIIKTVFGYHLLQLIERRGNSIHCRHILIKPEIGMADLAAVSTRLDSIRKAIRPDSLTFAGAVQKFSQDESSKPNNGMVTSPQTGSTYFEVGDLSPEVYFALDTMKIDGITKPIEMTEQDGSLAYRIIQLKSRSEPHPAALETDYNKVKAACMEQKKAKVMNDWMSARAGKIYVKVNEPYTACPNVAKWKPDMRQ